MTNNSDTINEALKIIYTLAQCMQTVVTWTIRRSENNFHWHFICHSHKMHSQMNSINKDLRKML